MSSSDNCSHREAGRILCRFPQDGSVASSGDERSSGLGLAARRVPVDGDAGQGIHEFHRLDEGFYLLMMNVQRHGAVSFHQAGESLIEFHYRLTGRLRLSGAWGAVDVTASEFLLWYQPAGFDDVLERVDVGADPDISVTLYCTPEWLAKAFGDKFEALPPSMRSILGQGRGGLHYKVLPHHAKAAQALHDVVENVMPGNLALMRAHSKALELLCLSLEALNRAEESDPPSRLRLSDRDLKNVSAARAILEAEFADPPPLNVLARRVGLNMAKLPFGFKKLYGETIPEFIRRRRLERAHELLASTDLQIGLVAAEVGYRHHSTFTAAFAEYFGVPPKSVVNARHAYGKAV